MSLSNCFILSSAINLSFISLFDSLLNKTSLLGGKTKKVINLYCSFLALICSALDLGIDPKVLKGVWETNLKVRPEKDWENLKGRAVIDSNKKE